MRAFECEVARLDLINYCIFCFETYAYALVLLSH